MAIPSEQLQAMHGLAADWDGYGAAAPQANAIDLAQEFVELIEAMLLHAGTPRVFSTLALPGLEAF